MLDGAFFFKKNPNFSFTPFKTESETFGNIESTESRSLKGHVATYYYAFRLNCNGVAELEKLLATTGKDARDNNNVEEAPSCIETILWIRHEPTKYIV